MIRVDQVEVVKNNGNWKNKLLDAIDEVKNMTKPCVKKLYKK